jgi:hypothetical protein
VQIHVAANISIFRRIAINVQKLILREVLDPSFSIEEFIEGAKMAYVVIRQITSNVKDHSQLDVLSGMVSPKLLQVAWFSPRRLEKWLRARLFLGDQRQHF